MNPWKFSVALLALVGLVTLGEFAYGKVFPNIVDGYTGTYIDLPTYYVDDETYPV